MKKTRTNGPMPKRSGIVCPADDTEFTSVILFQWMVSSVAIVMVVAMRRLLQEKAI